MKDDQKPIDTAALRDDMVRARALEDAAAEFVLAGKKLLHLSEGWVQGRRSRTWTPDTLQAAVMDLLRKNDEEGLTFSDLQHATGATEQKLRWALKALRGKKVVKMTGDSQRTARYRTTGKKV